MNTTGRRESMTVQVAAASSALVLGEERRINGQWRRGTLGRNPDLRMKEPIAQAGLILDVLGRDTLRAVRDKHESLNAAYERAQGVRREAELAARREAGGK